MACRNELWARFRPSLACRRIGETSFAHAIQRAGRCDRSIFETITLALKTAAGFKVMQRPKAPWTIEC